MKKWLLAAFCIFILKVNFAVFAATSKSKLKVFFDCTLTTTVSCQDLVPDLFISDPSLQQVSSPKDADVIVKIYALSSASTPTEQYEIKYIGQNSHPSLPDRSVEIPQSWPALQKLFKLLNVVVFGMAPYHSDVTDVKKSPDGKELIYTVSISDASDTKNSSQNSESPYTLSLSISSNVTGNDSLFLLNTGGGGQFIYDTMPLLVRVSGGGGYTYLRFNTGKEVLTGDNFSGGGGIDVISPVKNPHWNILLRFHGGHDPSVNVNFSGQAQTGIEYETHPRLQGSTNALNINYIFSDNYDVFTFPNIQQKLQQIFISHALTVFFLKHIERPNIDLSAATVVASIVNHPEVFGVGGRLTGTLNVNQAFAVSLTVNGGYKQNMVYTPADLNALGPLNPVINQTGPFSKYSYNVVLSVTYTYGNTLLPKQETRYPDVSNVPTGF